jgi:hypothetical protein
MIDFFEILTCYETAEPIDAEVGTLSADMEEESFPW